MKIFMGKTSLLPFLSQNGLGHKNTKGKTKEQKKKKFSTLND